MIRNMLPFHLQLLFNYARVGVHMQARTLLLAARQGGEPRPALSLPVSMHPALELCDTSGHDRNATAAVTRISIPSVAHRRKSRSKSWPVNN
jgi:hypothetical protein